MNNIRNNRDKAKSEQKKESQTIKKIKESRKKKFKSLKWHQKLLSYVSLAVLFVFWFIDRLMSVVMPFYTSPKFFYYCSTNELLKKTIAKTMMFTIPIIIYLLIEKYFI